MYIHSLLLLYPIRYWYRVIWTNKWLSLNRLHSIRIALAIQVWVILVYIYEYVEPKRLSSGWLQAVCTENHIIAVSIVPFNNWQERLFRTYLPTQSINYGISVYWSMTKKERKKFEWNQNCVPRYVTPILVCGVSHKMMQCQTKNRILPNKIPKFKRNTKQIPLYEQIAGLSNRFFCFSL